MVNIQTIEKEILDLEKKDTSYAVVERLAWLYTVRDHLRPASAADDVSPLTVSAQAAQSEFLKLIQGKPTDKVISVMDGCMKILSTLQPNLYKGILKELREL